MKKVIASAGMLAIGAMGAQYATADMSAGSDKPWSISATLRGFYDDNYNTAPDNSPQKRATWGFEVRPRADVSWSDGPNTLTASYIYDLRDYLDRPGNKLDQSHDLELFANHNFNERYSLDLEESFVDSQEPEVLDSSLSLPLRANGDNLRNTAAINFHAEITPLLGFVLGYANTWYDYTGNNSSIIAGPSYETLLNRFEHVVTLNSRWHLSEETVGILGYQFEAIDYTSTGNIAGPFLPVTPSNTRDNYTHNVYVGVEHSFRSDLGISARAGFQATDYYNSPSGNNDNSISPFVDISGNYTYMDGGVLTLGFRHSKNQTDVAGVTFNGGQLQLTEDQESSSVYGTVTQKLTPLSPNLIASVTAQFQNSKYNGGGVDGQTDQFFLVGLNLTYQFNRYFSAEAGYNYDKLNSDIPGRGYDRNRVYVGVTGSY